MVSRIVNQLYQMNVILEKMIEQNNTSEELHDIKLAIIDLTESVDKLTKEIKSRQG